MRLAKEEHQKAYDAAAALAAVNPEDSGNEEVKPVALAPTLAYHATPYFAQPVLPPSPAVVRTVLPSSFSYSINAAPQVVYQIPYAL